MMQAIDVAPVDCAAFGGTFVTTIDANLEEDMMKPCPTWRNLPSAGLAGISVNYEERRISCCHKKAGG